MEVTLKPDNRKATIVGGISDDLVKVKLEDGREIPWPVSKINMPPKEGEDTLKMVVIPAIDRLKELRTDLTNLENLGITLSGDNGLDKFIELCNQLGDQALNEFKQKWGL